MRKNINNHAFTLLEILIALAVLSIVMIASVRNSSTLSDNTAYLREKTIAHWVAMNKVSELKLSRNWSKLSNASGSTSMAESKWQWKVNVSPTSDQDIKKVEVSVNRVGKSSENPADIVTAYIGRPNY